MPDNNIILTPQEITTLRLLEKVPIFSGIGEHELHQVARHCRMEKANADTIVIEQDDVSNNLYIIINGYVLVSKRKLSNEWVKVNQLGPGDFFGEIALLRNVRRTARVTTKTLCTFLTMNGADFLEIYKYFPARARDNIQIIVAKRLAELSSYGV